MKHEDIYRRWVQEKREMHVGAAFAESVMDQIRQREGARKKGSAPWFDLIGRINMSQWTKAAVLGIASVLGLGRILLTLHLLLFA